MLSFLNQKQENNDDIEVLLPKNSLNKRVFAFDEDELKEMFQLNLKITTIKEETEQILKEKEILLKETEEIRKKYQNLLPICENYQHQIQILQNKMDNLNSQFILQINTINNQISNKINDLILMYNKIETENDIKEENYYQQLLENDDYQNSILEKDKKFF